MTLGCVKLTKVTRTHIQCTQSGTKSEKNLNDEQLFQAEPEQCGTKKLQIHRMGLLSWTTS